MSRHRRCDVGTSSPVATLCAALTMLLMALTLCLGSAIHTAAAPPAGTAVTSAPPVTGTPSAQAPADGRSAAHHGVTRAPHQAVTSAHPGDCHAGGACCTRLAHGGPAVVPAAPQPLPVALPCSPAPARQTVTVRATGLPPSPNAPDLHVLNVQRI
jgi:hypothetical protein